MVRRAKKAGFQLAHIHDSYWTAPKNMNHVRKFYRDILKEIAQSNLLESIMYDLTGEHIQHNSGDDDLWISIAESEYALS
jgi:DNA-directed RNA polymerase